MGVLFHPLIFLRSPNLSFDWAIELSKLFSFIYFFFSLHLESKQLILHIYNSSYVKSSSNSKKMTTKSYFPKYLLTAKSK